MKRFILGLSLAAVCGMATAQVNYTVTFKTDRMDVTKVYLREAGTNELLDSAECKDGQATFEGKVSLAEIAVFTTGNRARQQVKFILDEVPTVVSFGERNTLEAGSEQNRKLFAAEQEVNGGFNESMANFQTKLAGAREKYQNSLPDSVLIPLQKEYEELFEQRNAAIKKVVEENKDNLVAAAYIAECINAFGLDYVKTYLAAYPYKDAKILAPTHEYIAALERKAVGVKFTDFEMDDMEGTPHKLSDYVGKGNFVLVDFWASWCGPCRAEMPNVREAYSQFHPKGFEIVGISFDTNKDAWQKATGDLGVTWPQLSDLKGWECAAGKIYGIRGIPATILFDGEGKVVATDLRGEELHKKLEEIYK